jgi:hypothetical protein
LLWSYFAILLLHKFEEYAYPGRFKDYYNENILDENMITRFPLNDRGIILVNVILGWTAFLLAAILDKNFIWLAIGLLGVTILNGIMHTIMFIIKKNIIQDLLQDYFFYPIWIILVF